MECQVKTIKDQRKTRLIESKIIHLVRLWLMNGMSN